MKYSANHSDRAEQVNKVLYSIASAVNTTLDLEQLYQAIHHSLGLIIDVTNFFIAIVNSEKRTLHFPYWVDAIDDDFSSITDFDTSNSLTGLVVLRKKPLLLNKDELRERDAGRGVWGALPLTWMGVPLEVRGEVIGVIAVQSYTDPDIFDEEDLKLLTAVTDQTAIAIDRKRSLDNLMQSEQRFRQLFEQSNDAIIIHDLRGVIIDCNNKACAMLGYSRTQLLLMELNDLHFEEDRAVVENGIKKIDLLGVIQFETSLKQADGSRVNVEISSSVVDRDGYGTIQGLIRDVTERKKVEDLLLKNEEKYRNLFHNALVGLYRTHKNSRTINECNDALAHMFGYDNDVDFLTNCDPFEAYCDPEARDTFFNLINKKGVVENLEARIYKKSGDIGWFRFSARRLPGSDMLEGVVVDITEIREAHEKNIELQRKLESSKKMEALGLLAGGVAHDLNNILAGIISYPELMLMKYPDNHELRKPLEAILNSGKRGALIVADLLTIARSAASVKEIRNLHTIISDYLESPEFGQLQAVHSGISITTDLKAVSSVISCSSVHVNKCLMNLLTNAVEAIENSGRVIISTRNSMELAMLPAAQPSESIVEAVILSVQDTGSGIADEDIEHIFEPFYSRKIMGRSGTGLGLTVVWNSMLDHGGKVSVENNEIGTCFKLFFPVSEADQPVAPENNKPDVPTGQGETILVVDDEPHIRDIACQLLEAVGYTVDAVASGELALDYLKSRSVDLILLDMLMEPGMDGLKTYAEIIKIHPDQKAIIASGFSESENVRSVLQLGVGSFVRKPYSLEQISQAIRKELDRL